MASNAQRWLLHLLLASMGPRVDPSRPNGPHHHHCPFIAPSRKGLSLQTLHSGCHTSKCLSVLVQLCSLGHHGALIKLKPCRTTLWSPQTASQVP